MTILLETTTKKYTNQVVQVTTTAPPAGEGRERTSIEKKKKNEMLTMMKNDKMDTILTEMTTNNKKMKKQQQQHHRNNNNTNNDKLTGQDELRNVFLKMWDGKTLCWTMNPNDYENNDDDGYDGQSLFVSSLQNKVLQHYSHVVRSKDNFHFIGPNGKPLREDPMFNNNNNTGGGGDMTVHVHYRNEGGCFILSLSVLTMIMIAIIGSTCTCGMSLLVVPLLMPLLFILPLFCL